MPVLTDEMTAAIQALPGVTQIVAVEPDTRFHPALQRIVPESQIIKGTALHAPPDGEWDCLVSINVLEHIADDAAELALYCRLLASRRGSLCLFVPACPEIYAPLDRDFGHFRRYTLPELRRKLENAGFSVDRIHYYNLLGYFAWALTFRLLRRRRFGTFAVRFFDRLVFPVSHWLETRIFRPPFGQNLLVVARANAL